MVNIAILVPALALAFSGLADARDCTKGLRYCGYNLLKIGNYKDTIRHELQRTGHWSWEAKKERILTDNSRFVCGDAGAINYVDFCSGGCVDGGSDKNDFC
ncbi:hypothetical protein B0T24DRAFT_17556 [Lasiosphaeria ovina]|uniref:Uncharacterized protein n=1 Tax=Lasiosphaeria ovina TaxID=92902 RepID=A0AAE0NJD9_9PEZI|nr:hypothetical protein B0T24DRAFT_17556 [Lasiosphaeria ovina]